jgi:V/A-type H+-transporting ATPase subunit C
MGANVDAGHLLSDSGRIAAKDLNEAFITGQRGDLPPPVASAISSAVGILSRTHNPQLADIAVDKEYFAELSSLEKDLKDDFITGYIRLLIDSANLRIIVRSARTGLDDSLLNNSLIPGGSIGVGLLASSTPENALTLFKDEALETAVRLGAETIAGGAQTLFELACDNAVLHYATNTAFVSFGAAPVIAYLAKLEWELTTVRMILTGKLTGISPGVIRERLRETYV